MEKASLEAIKLLAQGAGLAVPAGAAAYEYMKSKNPFGSDKSTSNSSKGKKPSKRKNPSGTLAPDGTLVGTRAIQNVKKRKVNRNKKTLKDRIRSLEKNKPSATVQLYKETVPMTLWTNGNNLRRIYYINFLGKTEAEALISALNGVDFTTVNSNILIRNVLATIILKNNMTANAEVKYQWVKCANDSADNPLQNIIEELTDRGYMMTGMTSTTAEVAATALVANTPEFLLATSQQMYYPIFGLQGRNWKPLAPATRVLIGPGDRIELHQKIPNFKYKPEREDQDSFNHHKGLDYGLIISVAGDYQHNDTTNEFKVSRSGHRLDGERRLRMEAVVPEGGGVKNVTLVNGWDVANVEDPVHADNMISGIEAAAV